MDESQFVDSVGSDAELDIAIRRAAEEVPRRQFSVGLGEAALLIAMYPIVQFALTRIGLPWLYEAGRYSELWRQRFHRWLDSEYRSHGFDPDQAEIAGEALRKELEASTGAGRESWERLRNKMLQPPSKTE